MRIGIALAITFALAAAPALAQTERSTVRTWTGGALAGIGAALFAHEWRRPERTPTCDVHANAREWALCELAALSGRYAARFPSEIPYVSKNPFLTEAPPPPPEPGLLPHAPRRWGRLAGYAALAGAGALLSTVFADVDAAGVRMDAGPGGFRVRKTFAFGRR